LIISTFIPRSPSGYQRLPMLDFDAYHCGLSTHSTPDRLTSIGT